MESNPSDLETRAGTPDDIRIAQNAVRIGPVTWWYYLGSAVLIAGLTLTPLTGDSWTVWLAVGVVIFVLANFLLARKAGVLGMAPRTGGAYLLLAVLSFVVVAAAILWYRQTAQPWVLVIGAVAAAALTLLSGVAQRRAGRR